MTAEQVKWLQEHRAEGYQAVGRAPGGYFWARKGILHADGAFDLQQGRQSPPVHPGSIEVGILQARSS